MTARPWDPPNLPPVEDADRCRHHNGLCAYRDADVSRCATCHCSWSLILRSDRHSCWRMDRRGRRLARAEYAAGKRAERAASRAAEDVRSPAAAPGPAPHLRDAQRPS